MTEPATAQRLKELRAEADEIRWQMDRPEIRQRDYDDLEARLDCVEWEIARLSEYERLGYDEPNF